MYSSISNFRTELKVLLMVVLVLAVCELGLRVLEKRLSVDLTTPALAKRLAEGEGQRVLVFGNSLVKDNVNTDILDQELKAEGVKSIHIERIYLMNTIINDWYYAFKHHFVDAGRLPDVLVLCFSSNHLEDFTIQRTLIARYYSSARDIPQIFSRDVPDFDGRVEFLLSSVSASFTYRTNVQRRALDLTVPHYRESAIRINNALKVEANTRRGGSQPTYNRLSDLLRLAASKGVRVFLVAVPIKSPYSIDAPIKSTSEAAGAKFLDTRNVEGLSEDSFTDEMHMNSNGATVYSRFLARQLSSALLEDRPSNPGEVR